MGSEIESIVNEALYNCFDNNRQLDTKAIIDAAQPMVPLARTMAEDLNRLKKFAKDNCRPASSTDLGDEFVKEMELGADL